MDATCKPANKKEIIDITGCHLKGTGLLPLKFKYPIMAVKRNDIKVSIPSIDGNVNPKICDMTISCSIFVVLLKLNKNELKRYQYQSKHFLFSQNPMNQFFFFKITFYRSKCFTIHFLHRIISIKSYMGSYYYTF